MRKAVAISLGKMVSCTVCENRVVQFHGFDFANSKCRLNQEGADPNPSCLPTSNVGAALRLGSWLRMMELKFYHSAADFPLCVFGLLMGNIWIFKSVGKCTVRFSLFFFSYCLLLFRQRMLSLCSLSQWFRSWVEFGSMEASDWLRWSNLLNIEPSNVNFDSS